jgi:hypothetical protein
MLLSDRLSPHSKTLQNVNDTVKEIDTTGRWKRE